MLSLFLSSGVLISVSCFIPQVTFTASVALKKKFVGYFFLHFRSLLQGDFICLWSILYMYCLAEICYGLAGLSLHVKRINLASCLFVIDSHHHHHHLFHNTRVVWAPQIISQPVSSMFPVLHCSLGLGELQACQFPDVVFAPLPLSVLSSFPFHCALQDGFSQT